MNEAIRQVTHVQNIRYDKATERLYIIDQTLLPNEEKEIELRTVEEMIEAIKMLRIRGAPAIGICAGYCMYALARDIDAKDNETFYRKLQIDGELLGAARPTAVNLRWAVGEMLNRYKLFAATGTRDLEGYNRLAAEREELHPMPQIVIIIDELADLMMAAPKDVEDYICRLAQMARAAGMHLVIATQRPSVDVITGLIKANIPSRISFAVSSQIDSRTILDMGGAEKLLGRGDMLYYPVGSSKPTRVQGCFVTDSEVERVVTFIKQGEKGEYDDTIMTEIEQSAAQVKGKGGSSGSAAASGGDAEGTDGDELLEQAIAVVVEAGLASTSLLQRRLKVGYARAARLVDEMEEKGIVGPFEGSKPRKVLMTKDQYYERKTMSAD